MILATIISFCNANYFDCRCARKLMKSYYMRVRLLRYNFIANTTINRYLYLFIEPRHIASTINFHATQKEEGENQTTK